jgi:uracil-DNA glycosylase family 4
MNKKMLEKIEQFLENYKILYQDNFFVDFKRLDKLIQEMPDLEVEAGILPPGPIFKKITDEREKDTNSPLWQFEKNINGCIKCPLGTARTKFVFGNGNDQADIMFVGEAPGAEEDQSGIPFVGKAGKLLDKLLSEVRISREEIFIANILKCRPPGNRDPLPAEVNECLPYLNKQIELIQPKLIVALGRIAAQNLLNTTSNLKQLRGRLWQYHDIDLIVTYHPAAILRTTGWLNSAKEDFMYIAATYREKLKHLT